MKKGNTYIVGLPSISFQGTVRTIRDTEIVFDQVKECSYWRLIGDHWIDKDTAVDCLVVHKNHIIAYRPVEG